MKRHVYKVIYADGRTSCSLNQFSEYCLKYIKTFEVKAAEDSLGIFCFELKKDALAFMKEYHMLRNYKIIRVFPMGKKLKPKQIGKYIYDFYASRDPIGKKLSSICMKPPKGTVCYPSVIVCD
jgi:hypothetical protein